MNGNLLTFNQPEYFRNKTENFGKMEKLIAFAILSIPVFVISWKPLLRLKSHGFFRFFAWEGILWLLASNFRYWFAGPFSFQQIISWALLIISLWFVFAGIYQMKKAGKAANSREGDELYGFEKTTELVGTGIFRFIRHPMYSSLLLLSWAICLKNPEWLLVGVSCLVSFFLYLTAICDEKECTAYFGDKYTEYKTHTKRFIPYLF